MRKSSIITVDYYSQLNKNYQPLLFKRKQYLEMRQFIKT